MPAIIEADDCGTYVVKFRGAAQGVRALIAEVIGGELGRLLHLPVPQLVAIELDPVLARSEPDPEIQATLKASAGINIGLDYLPGALNWEPAMPRSVPELAAKVVWFDALISNVDRTARNPNMLRWHKQLYLIDHGAALYFHHDWPQDLTRTAQARFPAIKQHVLLPWATELAAANQWAKAALTEAHFTGAVAQVPTDWLAAKAEQYADYFTERLAHSDGFTEEAERAHADLL